MTLGILYVGVFERDYFKIISAKDLYFCIAKHTFYMLKSFEKCFTGRTLSFPGHTKIIRKIKGY